MKIMGIWDMGLQIPRYNGRTFFNDGLQIRRDGKLVGFI